MDEKTINPPEKGLARRRLLRGTFAAPAVMTLVSGSALAGTSLSCVVRQNQPGNTVSAGSNPDGTVWIRVPVWEKRQNVNRYTQFVSGADIASLLPPGGSYLPSGSWQCISITGTTLGFTVGTAYTTAQATTISALTMTQVSGLYVGVRIDALGKVVGVEPYSSANSAMHASCWTSFGGANPFKV
jgi:hypothetical protein